MLTSTLTVEGQVAIPEEIRRLGLEAGARLRIEIDAQGAIRLLPEPCKPTETRSRLPGLLRHLARDHPASLEEMDEAIAEEAVDQLASQPSWGRAEIAAPRILRWIKARFLRTATSVASATF